MFLLIISSVFYLAKVTSFSPVYILQPILSLVLVFYLNYINSFKLNRYFSLVFILLLSLIVVNLFFSQSASTLVNFICGLISFLVIISSYRFFSIRQFLEIINIALKSLVFILFFDSVYRLMNPSMPSAEAMSAVADSASSFYMFKFSTLMFADSNTVAIVCVSFLFLSLYCQHRFEFNFGLYPFFLFLIMLSCLSRSAIIASLISFFIFTKLLNNYLKFIIFTIFGLFGFVFFYNLISFDASFLSKFYIVNKFLVYILQADLSNLLFGVGLDKSPSVLGGIYSHIHIVTAIVEFGFVGAFSILLFLIFCLIVSNFNCLYVILPNLILGFSYFFYLGAPFVFVPMALIIALEYRLTRFGS